MTVTKKASLHGIEAFTTTDGMLAGSGGLVAGGNHKPSVLFPGPETFTLFEDFLGDTGDVGSRDLVYVEGDTGHDGTIVTGSNGNYRLTLSQTTSGAPACAALTQGVFKHWKPDAGGPKNSRMRMTARLKIKDIGRDTGEAPTHVFVGFSDTGGAEFPITDSGNGVAAYANDAFGLVFCPGGGDTGWTAVSVAAGGTAQSVVCGSSYGPSANEYTTVEMEYRAGPSDTGGVAHFWIDGVSVASISSPVTSNVALTPWIGGAALKPGDTGYIDIDYIHCANKRDTGM